MIAVMDENIRATKIKQAADNAETARDAAADEAAMRAQTAQAEQQKNAELDAQLRAEQAESDRKQAAIEASDKADEARAAREEQDRLANARQREAPYDAFLAQQARDLAAMEARDRQSIGVPPPGN